MKFLYLFPFFRTHSTFKIRYDKSWRRERLGPAVLTSDWYKHGLTRNDLMEALEAGEVVQRRFEKLPRGGHLGAIVFTRMNEPQKGIVKRFMCEESLAGRMAFSVLRYARFFGASIIAAVVMVVAVTSIFAFVLFRMRPAP